MADAARQVLGRPTSTAASHVAVVCPSPSATV
jgi:hypothetical protein